MSKAQRRRPEKGRQKNARGAPAATTSPSPATPGLGVFLVPAALTVLVALFSFTPRVQSNETLVVSVQGAALFLFVWMVVLFTRARDEGTRPVLALPPPRKQHYIQAMLHASIFLYWGYHWRTVYDHLWLLGAQLAFAFVFDILLHWSRRKEYPLGFGPFPIVFSTNLFLWFRDDWFYLQFLLLAVGFLGKEFIRWQREGKRVHIFNPSAFSLGLFSVVLILTGTTHLTWGQEIASTLTLAPYIYLYLFAVGLVVMYFFSITLVAASSAITLFGLSALYSAFTGVPYFLDSEIPAAVFLGLHLLVTDPSTSPRTPPGKLAFGVMYGLSVFGLYALLGAFGAPTFYDKLMAVPLLNLMVRRIDAAVQAAQDRGLLERLRFVWARPTANYAHMGVWIVFFGTMAALGRTDGRHTGDSLPFWVQACESGRPNACERLILLESTYCNDNSGWACNALAEHYVAGRIVEPDPSLAMTYFGKACELRFQPGCFNVLEAGSVADAMPRSFDLRLLLREGGKNLMETPEPELYARACEHGWTFACERVSFVP